VWEDASNDRHHSRTQIKKGNDDIYLPALRGNLVAVTQVSDNGEKVAKSIEVIKPPKP